MDYAINVLAVLGVVIVLVITHEFGHFTAAKLTGIKVTEFFVGFGPRILSFRRGETEYGMKWLLVGGYVKILGMNPDEQVSEEDYHRSYRGSPIWKRAVVIFSGSLVHLTLALLMIFAAIWMLGIPVYRAGTTVAEVAQTLPGESGDSPAALAGLRDGDRILAVDGWEVADWDQLREFIVDNPGEEVELRVEREGETLTLQAQLARRDDGSGYLGISPRAERAGEERYGFTGSLGKTGEWFARATYGVAYSFYRLCTPGVWKQLLGVSRPTVDRPVTVVGASRIAGEFAEEGAFFFLSFLAFILLFLAYVNLLPLPPLDGGYLLVLLVEKVRGKPVDLRKLYPVAVAVLIFFGMLFLLTLRLDITSPVSLP